MARQGIEILRKHHGEIYRWMERAFLELGVPPYPRDLPRGVRASTAVLLVPWTVTVLPHPALPGFKEKSAMASR
jgi:hypothetical protein